MTTLIDVMESLYRSEINCGISSFWDGGFEVWLGDDMNGKLDSSGGYYPGELSDAMNWLHDAAMKHYPKSAYAISHKDDRP